MSDPMTLLDITMDEARFCAIVDLQAAINRFLRETNDEPKPFVWAADPDRIIAAVRSAQPCCMPRSA